MLLLYRRLKLRFSKEVKNFKMRVTMDTPISELMHSDTPDIENIYYIDLDEDELMHWKYIKKERLPNGKCR